jgi:hypothetical protein
MGQFEDIIVTEKIKKEKKISGIPCRECDSEDTEASSKMYKGTYQRGATLYKKYKQFVRCYGCGKKYVMNGTDLIDNTHNTGTDVINVAPPNHLHISLPILRNASPTSIMDEIMTGEEMEYV